MAKQHRCLDCGTIQLHQNKLRCELCEKLHKDKLREQRNAHNRELYRIHGRPYQRKKYAYKPKKCKTPECEKMAEKNCTYCPECSKARRSQPERQSERRTKPDKDVKHTTSRKPEMEWLDNINAWLAEHNGVYCPKPSDMHPKPHEPKILYVRI